MKELGEVFVGFLIGLFLGGIVSLLALLIGKDWSLFTHITQIIGWGFGVAITTNMHR